MNILYLYALLMKTEEKAKQELYRENALYTPQEQMSF